MMKCLLPSFLLLGALTLPLHAELRVLTDFEGGNADVVKLDQSTKTLRIMPALREGRGWPCWWFFKLDGLTVGEEFTLEVQAQSKPFREKNVLAAAWCQPKQAWVSSDGQTWTPSEAGSRMEVSIVSMEGDVRRNLDAETALYRHVWRALCPLEACRPESLRMLPVQ